jgi:hypothetical protein
MMAFNHLGARVAYLSDGQSPRKASDLAPEWKPSAGIDEQSIRRFPATHAG